jgi:O-antigen ligase
MPRGLLIFALCLPLAVLLGFMLSDPLMGSNMAVISACLFMLLIPATLAVHHRALIWAAFAFIDVFFLPGQPHIWMVLSALSFGISILSRPLAKVKAKPVWDKPVLWSLFFILGSLLVTAYMTGGLGLRVMGSSVFGGRKYVGVVGAVVGFMALTMAVVPRRNAQKDVAVMLLAQTTAAVSNFAYMLGPSFYFLFLLFPAEMALQQAAADFSPALVGIKRYSGFGPASIGLFSYCLLRWGVKGSLRIDKPWRLACLLAALFLGLLAGFRSTILICILVGLVQFFAEGLHRTKFLAGLVAVGAAGWIAIAGFASSLPLPVQRALSFLPIKVDAAASADAKASLEWRTDMWRVVIREIPKHLWFGKGYAIDPTDLFLAEESLRRGFIMPYETSMIAGDYHNGPLSIIVSLGIIGSIGVILFLATSVRVLWRNMRYGDADIQNINTFLFSLFIGRLLFFLGLYGAFENEIWFFAATVGISLSINGGLKSARPKPRLPAFKAKPAREREQELAVI